MAGFPPEYLIVVRALLLYFYTCFTKSIPCPLLCNQFHYTWILQRRLAVLFLCSCSLERGILKMGGIEAALLSAVSAHSFSACHQLILNQTILFKGKPSFFSFGNIILSAVVYWTVCRMIIDRKFQYSEYSSNCQAPLVLKVYFSCIFPAHLKSCWYSAVV